jgi:hypothetical protein
MGNKRYPVPVVGQMRGIKKDRGQACERNEHDAHSATAGIDVAFRLTSSSDQTAARLSGD